MSNVHSVHIYDEHLSLIKRLCGILSSGLKAGNAVVLLATAAHRDQLAAELMAADVDVRQHAREGRFRMYDAENLLAEFMTNGKPDRDLFSLSVGKLLSDAKA